MSEQPTVVMTALRWGDDFATERDALGPGFTAVATAHPREVTAAQWRDAVAVVSVVDPLKFVAIEDMPNVRIYVTPSVGYDSIDIERWGAAGVPVCNTPDYGTQEVADHAIALFLSLSKCIVLHTEALRADPRGNWRPAHAPYARRLSACTMGIVGLGRIGTAAALRAKAFGMRVVCYDPYIENGANLALGIERVRDLKELFGQCDAVSIHVPLSPATRNLVGADILAAAKPGMILVNTARGPIVDTAALADALRSGRIAAAGLDVLPVEPPPENDPLIMAWRNEPALRDRLALAPHSAFCTPESVRDMRTLGPWVVRRRLVDGVIENCVNGAYLVGKPR